MHMRIMALADAAHIHTHKWASYITSRGHELEIISFRPANLDYARVHFLDTGVVRPEGGNWHYLLALFAARRHILQMAPDVLFCHYLTSYGLIGALLKSSLPLVTRLQGTDILVTPRRSPLYRLMARYVLARSDLIMVAGSHMKSNVRQLGGDGKPIIVVPIGVDLERFNMSGSYTRKRFSCLSNRRLDKNSNIDLILKAVTRVRQMHPSVHLTVAGDGPLKSDLEQLVCRLDLAPWVTFLGQVPYDNMPSLLHEHSVFLSMTSSDGTSNSLLEAMACGAFPIASDISANRPWISSGVNGFLVPLNRPDLLAQRILDAFKSPQLLSRAQSLNKEIVQERGDHLISMKRAEQALEQLVRGTLSEQYCN